MTSFSRISLVVLLISSELAPESNGAITLERGKRNERIIHISDKRLGVSKYHKQRKKKEHHDAAVDSGVGPSIAKLIPHFDYDYLPDDKEELYVAAAARVHKRQDDDENSEDTGEFVREISNSFDNHKAWPVESTKCDSTKNKFLSPVDIPTKSVSQIKDSTTLFVYSKYPQPKTYQISTQYVYDSVKMEAFTIRRLNDDVIKDATYISGIGSNTERYFQSALIMIRPPAQNDTDTPPLPPERSFHKLDGKEFPMEIMFSFESNNHVNPEKTQMHVLVELSENDNPAWTPIIEMLELEVQDPEKLWSHIRVEGCVGRKQLEEVEQEYGKSRMKKKKAQKKRAKLVPSGMHFNEYFRDLQEIYEAVKDMDEKYIKQLTTKKDDLDRRHGKCQAKFMKLRMKLKAKDNDIYELEESLADLKDNERREAIRNLNKARKDSNDLQTQVKSMHHHCMSIDDEKVLAEGELEKVLKTLEKSSIGDSPNAKYKTVEDLKKELETLVEARDNYDAAFEELRKIESKLNYILEKPKRSTLITLPFQISWLFPAIGGYYTYPGSFVVKPCNRRAFLIVMENPITISKEQMKYFLNFPTVLKSSLWKDDGPLCDENKYDEKTKDKAKLKAMQEYVESLNKIKNQVPEIHELGDRKVEYERKNLQYVFDDGFHMNSKLRYRLKHGVSRGHSLASIVSIIMLSTLLSLAIDLRI